MEATEQSSPVEAVVCPACGQRAELTPKRRRVRIHGHARTGVRPCEGTGQPPIVVQIPAVGGQVSPAPEADSQGDDSPGPGDPQPAPENKPPRPGRIARLRAAVGRLSWITKVGAVLAGIAATFGFMADLGIKTQILGQDPAEEVEPMGGTYNVAVADFVALGEDADDPDLATEGQALADGLHTGLADDLCVGEAGEFDVECRGPRGVPPVDEERSDARAALAEQTARELNADMLVYGTISSVRGQEVVNPAIYLSPERLPQLEELAGSHLLVGSEAYVSTGSERRQALQDLRERLRNITDVMFTLDTFNLSEPGSVEAEQYLEGVAADGDWRFDQHILELLRANVLSKQERYDEAIPHYDESLRLYESADDVERRPYSRATVGRAEATFHILRRGTRGDGDCHPPDADDRAVFVDDLERLLVNFATGRAAALHENADPIVHKADFGIGRVQACLAQAGGASYWGDSEDTFRALVGDLEQAGDESGLTSIEEELLAEGHSFLGFIGWRRTDVTRTEETLAAAAEEYRTAAEVTHLDHRRDVYRRYADAINEALLTLPAQ